MLDVCTFVPVATYRDRGATQIFAARHGPSAFVASCLCCRQECRYIDAEFDASHKKLDTALLLCVIAVLVVMEEPATLVRDVTEAVLSAPRQFDFIESQTLNGSIAIGLSLLSLYSWALLYGVERTAAAVQRPWTAALHSALLPSSSLMTPPHDAMTCP